MNQIHRNLAYQSIFELHEWIEALFTGKNRSVLIPLLDSFSPNFEMITTIGTLINLDQVRQLFTNNTGKHPNLKITISEVSLIQQTSDSCLYRYKETHNHQLIRWVTILIVFKKNQPFWLHLQETMEKQPNI
ncbi:hypothetical protein [Acinetobacter sp. HY1485]|uniref:hypothetical protein n=1 Tax=Acinetobacter sp. HY1485 TaxID=2970918 RepID=UPI0022B9C034|nr:hypothetical protein [Acinetobacter sp. HY1485]